MKKKLKKDAEKKSDTKLVTTRVRFEKKRSGISGFFDRASRVTITPSKPTPPKRGKRTCHEPQAWVDADSNPSTIATRPPVAVIAPAKSIRPPSRTIRLSDTSLGTASRAKAATGRLM